MLPRSYREKESIFQSRTQCPYFLLRMLDEIIGFWKILVYSHMRIARLGKFKMAEDVHRD